MNKDEFVFYLGKLKGRFPEAFICITLYDKPSDEPENYVARAHVAMKGDTKPTNVYFKSPDRAEVEGAVPDPYFYWLDREPNDDPTILGTWIFK
ncbi:hypothetical protein J7384_17170 [Endozoicomonas sp. G2_1]|uniref:hypothetical protein n=1 Tax=Endozoicomonas sp. G2_1 TaxID=2821091 RepID=UPI001ADB228E|nr:hypothetical protein [Endozoicomonas sp. G2_1]MBO9492096.1 hypothetical protein [Endozoicomonas sp. G2_1]